MSSWIRRTTWMIGLLAAAAALPGCAAPVHDPEGFAILNGSGQVLTVLTVREVSDDPLVPQRIGRFENVPPNTVQYVRRAEDAPPVPEELEVVWQPRDGERQERRVALRDALDEVGPVGRDALVVLEIGPDGTVSVTVADE